jgi:hypothetical protein
VAGENEHFWGPDYQALAAVDPEIAQVVLDEVDRLNSGLQLIASENLTSPAVLAALGSTLSNKYAEGYPGRRYYGGCQIVDLAEEIGIARDHLPGGSPGQRLRALFDPASTQRAQRLRPGLPYGSEATHLEDPTDNDPAQRDMVEQSAVWVDFVLDTVAGPAPARRGYRDRVPGIGRALEWSRHRSARGAIR